MTGWKTRTPRGRIRPAFGVALVSLALSGCPLPFAGGDVEVRLENETPLTFTEVRVYFEPTQTFRNLGPGKRTSYVTVDRAYDIVTLVAKTATDSTRLQVIDHVGDEPLGSGRYTFTLFAPDPNAPLQIGERVKKD